MNDAWTLVEHLPLAQSAHRADVDHTEDHAHGGDTSIVNLAHL